MGDLIKHLEDRENFGEWLVRINEIINLLEDTTGLSDSLEETVDSAVAAGQIGSPLPDITNRDYDAYTFCGLYHMDSKCIHGPEEGKVFNLYSAASKTGRVTHLAVSNDNETPRLYIRTKAESNSKFGEWTRLISKNEADATYFKVTGGEILGDLKVTGGIIAGKQVECEEEFITRGDIRLLKDEYGAIIQNTGNKTRIVVTYANNPEGQPTLQEPLVIDNITGIGSINGTAEKANLLNPSGMSDDLENGDATKAASSFAIVKINTKLENEFMRNTGGEFTGIVKFNEHITLGYDKIIYSPSNITFRPTNSFAIVANHSYAEMYLDRDNEPVNEGMPSVYGTRTRTGIVDYNPGTVVFETGSIEFTEDDATIRVRKKNVTTEEDVKPNVFLKITPEAVIPSDDAKISLGSESLRFDQVYSSNAEISTSDKNLKTDIDVIDQDLLDDWKDVKWVSFKMKDSVEEKGDAARIHCGLIAQDVQKAVQAVDVEEYGLFCHDKWDDIWDTEVITVPAVVGENGEVLEEERKTEVRTLRKAAGEQYSLRYQEAQAVENAYLRRELGRLKDELNRVKKLLDIE